MNNKTKLFTAIIIMMNVFTLNFSLDVQKGTAFKSVSISQSRIDEFKRFEVNKLSSGQRILKIPTIEWGRSPIREAVRNPLRKTPSGMEYFKTLKYEGVFIWNGSELKFTGYGVEKVFEFEVSGQLYWATWVRGIDGSGVIEVSKPLFKDKTIVNLDAKIYPQITGTYYQFIRDIKKDSSKSGLFLVTIAPGNGINMTISTYLIDLRKTVKNKSENVVYCKTSSYKELGSYEEERGVKPTIIYNQDCLNSNRFISKNNTTQSYKVKGDEYLAQKQWNNAIATYTQVIKLSPRYAELYYNRGLAYLSSDNKKAALTNFEEAAELFLQQRKWDDRKDAISMITQIDSTLDNDYKLTESSRLTLKGIGPVRVGMTIDEATRASGSAFIYKNGSGTCSHYEIKGDPQGTSFLVMDSHIASIYVMNPSIKTIRGIKIGDSESKIKSIYADQLKVEQVERGLSGSRMNRYTFIPKDLEDRSYRYIFYISNGVVKFLKSGKLPEVEYSEGCF